MPLLNLEIFSNTSNEVIAAYVTGAIGVVFGIFQFLSKERDRRKSQTNAIELEQFKQRSELFLTLKKNQIGYNEELLNEVYKVRRLTDETIVQSELPAFEFLHTGLKDFVKYYRNNASKIHYLDGGVRSFGHDILICENKIAYILKMVNAGEYDDMAKDQLTNTCLRLQELCKEYEEFLRQAATREFKNLKNGQF
ncbi:hypothetical protein [Pedobacter soli]|uniref:Uncharacterized protein n=1 Tax=Pedobacter soli TaxID=390242 RepID=A0A1G6WMI2_9SPHI|nr:hypothetical protein [Pedobacter soli]SDD67021.1 hypothetical protein SAMN04488024_10764 [Pedobacter soli]